MKYLNRFFRWLKCQHKWEEWRMDDPLNPISYGKIFSLEKLDLNKEKIKICLKCREIRTFGKKVINLWM